MIYNYAFPPERFQIDYKPIPERHSDRADDITQDYTPSLFETKLPLLPVRETRRNVSQDDGHVL